MAMSATTGTVERDALERARLDLNHLATKYDEQEFVAPTVCKIVEALSRTPTPATDDATQRAAEVALLVERTGMSVEKAHHRLDAAEPTPATVPTPLTSIGLSDDANRELDELRDAQARSIGKPLPPVGTPATGEIVERLRRKPRLPDTLHPLINPDGPEAAALIEQHAATIAERDARIEALENLLAEYGDRVRMARAEPAEKQWLIDEALANVASRATLERTGR